MRHACDMRHRGGCIVLAPRTCLGPPRRSPRPGHARDATRVALGGLPLNPATSYLGTALALTAHTPQVASPAAHLHGVRTSAGSRPSALRSAHSAAGMGTFMSRTLQRTSSALFPPGMTHVTAGWPRGNCGTKERRVQAEPVSYYSGWAKADVSGRPAAPRRSAGRRAARTPLRCRACARAPPPTPVGSCTWGRGRRAGRRRWRGCRRSTGLR